VAFAAGLYIIERDREEKEGMGYGSILLQIWEGVC
jgi:hypothetical protein